MTASPLSFLGPATTQNLVVKFDSAICGGVLVVNVSDDFPQQTKLENLLPNFAGSSPPISPKVAPTSLWKSLVLKLSHPKRSCGMRQAGSFWRRLNAKNCIGGVWVDTQPWKRTHVMILGECLSATFQAVTSQNCLLQRAARSSRCFPVEFNWLDLLCENSPWNPQVKCPPVKCPLQGSPSYGEVCNSCFNFIFCFCELKHESNPLHILFFVVPSHP